MLTSTTATITLPSTVVLEAVKGLLKAIPKKSTLPIVQSILIEQFAGGAVRLSATDLDNYLSYTHQEPPALTALARSLQKLRQDRIAPCRLAIPAKTLRYVAGISQGDLTLAQDTIGYTIDGYPAEYHAPESEPHLPPDEFPEVPECSSLPEPVRLTEAHTAAILQGDTFSSSEETRYVLNGVYLETLDKCKTHSTVVATDGRRMFACEVPRLAGLPPTIIPTKTMPLLALRSEWLITCVQIDEGSSTVYAVDRFRLTSGNWCLTGKVIDGNYPNYSQVLATAANHVGKIPMNNGEVAKLRTILRQLPAPAKKGDPFIHLTFQRHMLTITEPSSRVSAFLPLNTHFTTIPSRAEGQPPMIMGINRNFLQDALSIADQGILYVNEETDPIVFRTTGGEAQVIVMPSRIS